MRDRFLGDSLDMSKRATVSLLRDAGYCLLICPLPSEADFSETVYRSCLALREKDKLFNPALRFRRRQRDQHLAALRDELSKWKPENPGIVLLDPDKGVHGSKKSNQFVTEDEVNSLVVGAQGHVIAIYHHKNAGSISYLDLVARFMPRPAMAYGFGAAVLCFVHSDAGQLRKLRQVFGAQLNPARVLPNEHEVSE